MFSLGSQHQYFLYRSPVDMRKGFNGLYGMVINELDRDPVSGEVFVFVNRHRNLIKLLHWEKGGFVVYYKRLEKGTFLLPEDRGDGVLEWPELVLMVEGIQVDGYRQRPRYIPG
ncbi:MULTISPECIES: IS66 family insertion sequence element accessory protein TnpB [Echinicola]|uniref:Transposase n=3 Tax=Echinicola TaxID=390846 RepID=L0G735_ECHVK|nr:MULTISPECIES: IS66 family insertion sequence element accessory protein TnpB [Echinicola]AGA80665.1 transposase [Echinicola vietnamensis DSM 17526]AWW29482.1 IS66 family insertion sequence hypothetical protein [Echinicola strongylocentroti]GGF44003.1 transposase [Echinicola rosea]